MVRKRDQFWEYAEQLEGKFKCKFCDKIFPGSVSRVKPHLSGIKGCGVDICTKVPEDVRVAAAEAISGPHKRAKTEACSGRTEESSPKMPIGKDHIMLDKLLAKFILLNDLDVNIVRRPSFTDFVNAVAEHGSHYRLPCCSVVKTKLLPDLEKEIGEHVANVKKSWDRTGCTLMSAIWGDKDRSFINIFACSIEGMVLLSRLDIHKDELTNTLLRETSHFATQEIGANNIVQYITNSARKEGLYEDMPIGNYPHVYRTNCATHEIQVLFEDIYNNVEWVQKAFDQARAVVTKIHKYDGILSSMKWFTSNWELKQSSITKIYLNYYMLQSIMGIESELRLLVSSSKWLSLGFEKDESGVEVGEIIRSSEFWSEGKEVLHALEPIFQVLCLVDSYGATFGFLYAAVEMANEAIRQIYEGNVPKYQSLWDAFQPWQIRIIHPMHAAAAFLNPSYMCSKKYIENDAMKHGMNIMLEKLVGDEEKESFVQEMMLYRNKVPKLFNSMAVTMLGTSHPCDWWDYCGDALPILKKYAIRILSQPCSTSFCRQSLSAFETAQTEKREQLMPAGTDNYLYLRTNALLMENFNAMKEKIRKPLDLEKLGELPDFTEFINDNCTHDLLNETKVLLSDGKKNCWSASAREDGESEKYFRLHFITKLPSSLVKGNEVKGGRGAPIHVILVDSSTGRIVESGPLSGLNLIVTVIEGDFDEVGKNWTRDFFGSNEIMGREGNMSLLTGELSVILDKGMGTLGAIAFNDVSSWTKSGKFKLGVKTPLGCIKGVRVIEGTSNAFAVEDGRVILIFVGTQSGHPNSLICATVCTEWCTGYVGELLSENFASERQVLNSVLVESMWKMVIENLPKILTGIGDHISSVAQTTKDGTGSSVEPPSTEVVKQRLSSRQHCQIGNTSAVVSRSFGDAQEAACNRVNDSVSVRASTSCLTGDLPRSNERRRISDRISMHHHIAMVQLELCIDEIKSRAWAPPDEEGDTESCSEQFWI